MKKRKGSLRRRISLLLILLWLPAGGFGEKGEMTLTAPEGPVRPWDPALILFTLPREGRVDVTLADENGRSFFTVARGIEGREGRNSLYWNGTSGRIPAPAGTWFLKLDAGYGSALAEIRIGAEEGAEGFFFTPASPGPFGDADRTLNYWTLPMNIRYEEAVWQVLTSPITVVDSGNGEKAQVTIRKEPAADAPGVGVVTCVTQGVHVLERGEEWTLIECYSSSFKSSKILNWNTLVQGYVPTRFLREEIPNQEMGMVVDKLTQRLYIFREGKLFSTLLVSTGAASSRQPFNETRSGEFLMTSKVGDFPSGNLVCPKAIRFNSGDLMHEVPYIRSEGGAKSYAGTESRLGTRASHGCIRVQRKETPEGVNMQWIWAHLGKNSKTRLLIWEDWQGRQMETPPEDLPLYYDPAEARTYHSGPSCSAVRADTVMESFPYGRLEEEPFVRMKSCAACAPAPRRSVIGKINEVYAPGGDHDPELTKARKSCPRPGK